MMIKQDNQAIIMILIAILIMVVMCDFMEHDIQTRSINPAVMGGLECNGWSGWNCTILNHFTPATDK